MVRSAPSRVSNHEMQAAHPSKRRAKARLLRMRSSSRPWVEPKGLRCTGSSAFADDDPSYFLERPCLDRPRKSERLAMAVLEESLAQRLSDIACITASWHTNRMSACGWRSSHWPTHASRSRGRPSAHGSASAGSIVDQPLRAAGNAMLHPSLRDTGFPSKLPKSQFDQAGDRSLIGLSAGSGDDLGGLHRADQRACDDMIRIRTSRSRSAAACACAMPVIVQGIVGAALKSSLPVPVGRAMAQRRGTSATALQTVLTLRLAGELLHRHAEIIRVHGVDDLRFPRRRVAVWSG